MTAESPRSIVVVGASLAGLSVVRELRAAGCTAAITVVGDERHMPYDRPPLSKEFLHTGSPESVSLMDDNEMLDATWRLGCGATGITSADGTKTVHLADGTTIDADVAIIATGARARTLIGAEEMNGVHTLRSLDDAVALSTSLSKSRSVVVIGAGFIGAEVASTAAAKGLDVTVVEASTAPLAGVLGPQLGALCADRHSANGVTLLTGAAVERLISSDSAAGAPAHVVSVALGDGTILPADTVVIGIGAVPNTEWAAGSGLAIDNGFMTDSDCSTAVPGIYAIGDCARSFDDALGDHHRSEHWTNATSQAKVVAAAIMGTAVGARNSPYFWSNQYGKMLQFAGRRQPTDTVRFVDGDETSDSFVAVYERDDDVVAVFSMANPKLFTRYRKQIDKKAVVAS